MTVQASTVPDVTTDERAAVRERHRAIWASGDYPTLAATVIPDLGADLVTAAGVGPDDEVLDVAAGAGNATIPAALTGARVTASDITPELLDAGRDAADRAGVSVRWEVGDAQALPEPDHSFDVVLSSVGVMFAPDHRRCAAEMLRVCRPGGRIALASWTPEGFVGEMLRAMGPFVPTPPPGSLSPLLWGTEEHLRDLFGDRIADLSFERRTVSVRCFEDPVAFREMFRTCYGPTVAAYRSVGGDVEQVAELDAALDALAARHHLGGTGLNMEWEYLLVVMGT